MQRIAPNTVPPRQSGNDRDNSGQSGSPALMMGRRIRAEQGVERARQYLSAMEPFVAPAERAHIAQQLGIPLPAHSEPRPEPPPQNTQSEPQNFMPNFGGGGMPNLGQNFGGLPNFMGGNNNLAQMMQMMNAFGGLKGGSGKMDPMMMAQMLGMMGKK